jgi:hypothetical protein
MTSSNFGEDDQLFHHCVITQFNLRNFDIGIPFDRDTWVNWTRERIVLFETYCLPSFLRQTNKEFCWLIFLDKETPEEFRPFLDRIAQHSFIQLCYSDGAADFYENHLSVVKQSLPETTRWVITSRVDNDDCIHEDFIATIQSRARPYHGYLVSLASGYILDINSNKMSHYYYPMSPFISLVETTKKPMEGIFSRIHTQWAPLRLWMGKELWLHYFVKNRRVADFVLRKTLWIQIVHGKNVSNSFYRGLPVTTQRDLSPFSLARKNTPASLLTISKYFHYVTLKRYFKCTIIRILTNK